MCVCVCARARVRLLMSMPQRAGEDAERRNFGRPILLRSSLQTPFPPHADREPLAGGGGEGAGREKFVVTTLAFEGVSVPARLFSVHCTRVFAVLEVVVEVHVEHLRRRGGREGQNKGFDENGREKSRRCKVARLFFGICSSQDFRRFRKGKWGVGRPSDPSGLRKLSCG